MALRVYSKSMLRTYMMYAGPDFLGYEYGETETEVLLKTCKKFGEPSNWNIENYTADIIRWPEELKCKSA